MSGLRLLTFGNVKKKEKLIDLVMFHRNVTKSMNKNPIFLLWAVGHKKQRGDPEWKMLTLFVWVPEWGLVGVGGQIIKEEDFFISLGLISRGLSCRRVRPPWIFLTALRLMGQRTAVIGPLTLFHQRSGSGRVSLSGRCVQIIPD